ncbi:MAG: recJ [Gammaproteobacteria bacterium]|jgi:single-stranded-DNA-specific exonuclease|nr:recJ [Gammaproteobacteria bacterium]
MKKTITRRTFNDNALIDTDLHPLLKRIYAARGVSSLDELSQELNDLLPFNQLKGIEDAISVLYNAMNKRQHVLILGDFDADGATSAALAVTALRSFGLEKISYLVPNRFEYGYGLTPEIVDVAHKYGPHLIVTVDNGIASMEGVDHAKSLGMNVIITDHHLPGKALPKADAIVNPNQPGDTFPSKNLAGVGVIFYVMLALRAHLRTVSWFEAENITEPNMGELLDLVALGTVADVVPLDKNNRILVYQGLKRMRSGKARPGIRALIEVAKRNISKVVTNDLGFGVAPRLNAAGRLEDMSLGIECLLTPDKGTADRIAIRLDRLNNERKQIESTMQAQASTALQKLQLKGELPSGLCLYDQSWHQGVIGILASRVKEKFHRPTIIFAQSNAQELKGSARSIPGLHIRDAMDAVASQYPGLIQKFGGHAMAAGLSLKSEHYEAFSKAFAEEVDRCISPEDLQGKIVSDGELAPQDFDIALVEILKNATPWGQCFPEPLFDNCFQVIEQRVLAEKHLKMILRLPETDWDIEAIAFNVDREKWPDHGVEKLRIAYRLDINEFGNTRSLQLIVAHIEILNDT